jgi:Fe-S-cluster containining protein
MTHKINQGSLIRLVCWQLLYPFIFYIKTLKAMLESLITSELFCITGGCQHSGNCCREIMLFHNKNPIDSKNKFLDLIDKENTYARFFPLKKYGQKIYSFGCSCLTKDNKCSDYSRRPMFCRNYPESYFLEHYKLYPKCGYSISRTAVYPFIFIPEVKKHFDKICFINEL